MARPLHTKGPEWRSHRARRSSAGGDVHGDGRLVGEHSTAPESPEAPAAPRRTLKAHASDESTVVNEESTPQLECVDVSSNSSISGSAGTSVNSWKSGGPGRRQKARQRQLEWEEASRMSYLESVRGADFGTGQGSSSFCALGALTSVFENLVEDDCSGERVDELWGDMLGQRGRREMLVL